MSESRGIDDMADNLLWARCERLERDLAAANQRIADSNIPVMEQAVAQLHLDVRAANQRAEAEEKGAQLISEENDSLVIRIKQAEADRDAALAQVDSFWSVVDLFEEKQRGSPQAEIAAQLCAEFCAALAATAPQPKEFVPGRDDLMPTKPFDFPGTHTFVAHSVAPQPKKNKT